MPTLYRVYVGRLSSMVQERDLQRIFKGYGILPDVTLKRGYAFVEFESKHEADDAVRELDGLVAFGERIQVQHAKGTPRGEDFLRDLDRGYKVVPHRSPERRRGRGVWRSGYRIAIKNLSSRINRQDLKELMRKVGRIVYCEAHEEKKNEGAVEFETEREMERAIEKYDGYELNDRKLEVFQCRRSRASVGRERDGSRTRSPRLEKGRSRSPRRRRSSRSRSGSRSGNRKSHDYDRKRKERSRSADRRSRSHSMEKKPRRGKSKSYSRSPRGRSRDKSESPVKRDSTRRKASKTPESGDEKGKWKRSHSRSPQQDDKRKRSERNGSAEDQGEVQRAEGRESQERNNDDDASPYENEDRSRSQSRDRDDDDKGSDEN